MNHKIKGERNMNKVTIVMYHYVRDLKHSRYPEIKGLDVALFIEQIEYLQKHYNFVTMESVIDAFDGTCELPPKAVLLTFDDAYIDHYHYVFPILSNKNIQGSFFPPAKAIIEKSVLDVNKIHFILASVKDKDVLINDVLDQLKKYRSEFNLKNDEFYLNKLAIENRFDTKEVIFIKRLLQVELEEELRKIIINYLFQKYVSDDETVFSRELYMDIEQLKCMKKNGMFIGGHGYKHYWLGSLDKEKQLEDIDSSLDFLQSIGVDTKKWAICFPYGSYNQDTIDILKNRGCKLGLTSEVGIADISKHKRHEIPRLDTNDLPKYRHETQNSWYIKG